jgi:capsule biosynthesis phosphatase
MKRLVFDLDGTLTHDDPALPYPQKQPNLDVVARLREYHAQGFEIVILTARNMRTHAGNLGRINAQTLPGVIAWLNLHDIPFDEIHVGKPWCGHDGFYVDDKAIRPSEFAMLDYDGIRRLLAREGASDGGL